LFDRHIRHMPKHRITIFGEHLTFDVITVNIHLIKILSTD